MILTTSTALEVFVKAYAHTRGIASACEALKIGPLWVIRDVPGFRTQPRTAEFIVPETVDTATALKFVRESPEQTKHVLSFFRQSPESGTSVVAELKVAGYRYVKSEPLMLRGCALSLHDQHTVRGHPEELICRQVTNEQDAKSLAVFARSRQLAESDIGGENSQIRAHIGLIDNNIVCFARSVLTTPEYSYLGGMFTSKKFRRQGFASAVLQQTLYADFQSGFKENVLLASQAGEQLYTSLGYTTLSRLYIFVIPTANTKTT